MFNNDDLSLDCKTCIGAGTTACNECVVMHLLANDDGPIDYVPVQLVEVPRIPTPEEVAVEMLQRAGLVDDAPVFVSVEEFESHEPRSRTGHHAHA